mgnify:CR=1 FL=1
MSRSYLSGSAIVVAFVVAALGTTGCDALKHNDAPDAAAPGPCTQVHVVGTRVIDPTVIADRPRGACLRLAEAAGSPLIGIEFAANADGQWDMTGASVLPDLIGGGDPLADALAEALVP